MNHLMGQAKMIIKPRITTINTNYWMTTHTPKQVINSEQQVSQKVIKLYQMIKKATYPIIFTGAGISTSLGIPDYRSGSNTVVKTGTGLWNRDHVHQGNNNHLTIDKLVDLAEASISHTILAALLEKGIIKHIISQNTDGLHLKSGVDILKISELHGNRNLQFCVECGTKYMRPFRTLRRTNQVFKPGEKRGHKTQRQCQKCGGDLHDSIIYFGQKLPRQQLIKAYSQAQKSDLCICIGASLTVKPSSNIPLLCLQKENASLCIINIQQTPLDQYAQLRINYFCDDVLELLMKQLTKNQENQ